MSDWRTIDSAPKDGTRLWLFWPDACEDDRQTVGWWRTGVHGDYWMDHADSERENPTHWMPLPEPPATPSKEQAE